MPIGGRRNWSTSHSEGQADEISAKADIHILMSASLARYDDRDKALTEGCDSYFSKAVDFHNLRVRIRGLFEERSQA